MQDRIKQGFDQEQSLINVALTGESIGLGSAVNAVSISAQIKSQLAVEAGPIDCINHQLIEHVISIDDLGHL